MAPRLTHDEFFAQLAALFDARRGKDHGRIYLTQKRLSHGAAGSADLSTDPFADLHPEEPLPVIIRATDGKSKKSDSKKVKLSTVVEPKDLEHFFGRYADVCKAGMTGLKKRVRRKDKGKKKRGPADTETKA